MLSAQILERLAKEYGADPPELSDAALTALQAHSFPGNVRELENVLERAFTLCDRTRIEPRDLNLPTAKPIEPEPESADGEPEPVAASTSPAAAIPPSVPAYRLEAGQSLEDYLEGIERQIITTTLEATRWNKTAAAKKLGITFRALRYRLKKLSLE
jgi:two-component system response regulator PilR (NtrC family)